MLQKIKELEKKAKALEPNEQIMQNWDREVEYYAHGFIKNIEHIKAYVMEENKEKNLLNFPIPNEPKKIEELLSIIKENIDTTGLNPASGGHLGYIPGGGVYPTALGDYLTDVFNRYAGIFFAGPGAVRLENMLIRWMCSVVGFPQNSLGNLTSGGSIANLIAIVTARDAKNINSQNIQKSCIYLTKQVHHSLQKALKIAGLSECRWRYVPYDKNFKMDVSVLEKMILEDKQKGLNPFLAIGSAGTTDTGAIDPLDEMAKISEKHNLWFHVDAAYGGFFMLIDDEKTKFKGIEKADSITIDPHKGLFLAYGTGAVLIKDVKSVKTSHQYQANYMQDAVEAIDEPSPADLSPELTKNFRGLRMWLPLQLFGLDAYKACIEEKLWLCRYFYQEIQKMGFEVGPNPELSVCIYRYVPQNGDANVFNKKLVDLIQSDGTVFLSSTTIDGVFWIRIAILSFRSHLSTIEQALSMLKEKRDLILGI